MDKVIRQFEEEKKRIKSVNSRDESKIMGIKNNINGSDDETFHFPTAEEAKLAAHMIFEYCNQNNYVYSHACCDGKGHQIKKKDRIEINI
jgi:hypothetical protein